MNEATQVSPKVNGESQRTRNGQRERTFALQHNQTTGSGHKALQSHKGGYHLLREPRE